MKKEGLEPVLDDSTRILILGSMPGDRSLQQEQYYANPGNDFWKLVGRAIDADLESLNYEDRKKLLIKYGIGLWDVYKNCDRAGSLDATIKNEEFNDFAVIRRRKDIQIICFNGKEAGKIEPCFRLMGYKTKILPSSSGANRRNNEKRFAAWRKAIREHMK